MKNLILLIIGCVVLFVASCGTVQFTSFECLEAAEVSFPEVVRKVGVVNNMLPAEVVEQPGEAGENSLEGDGKIATERLAAAIADTRYFDQVVICDSALRANDTTLRETPLLTRDEIQHLTEELDVDLLFSFDRIHVATRMGAISYIDLPFTIPTVDAVVTPVIRAYIPDREKPLMVISKQDTIFWEIGTDFSYRKVQEEASDYAATLPINYLLPHWKEVTRNYYDGGNVAMRDAGVCVRENDWEGAYALWKSVYDTKSGNPKMKAAFNIALYYEVQDDLKQAVAFAEEAVSLAKPVSKEAILAQIYLSTLNERYSNQTKLKMQMNRFSDNNS